MPESKIQNRYFHILWPAALVLFASGCAAIHVSTDYNHRTDFARYHTYSWLKVKAGSQLWADRIQRDVNAELAAKGWREVPSGGQAAVAAFGATRNQKSLQTFYEGFGPGFGGWYWGGWGPGTGVATTQVVNTPVGSLTVDIFNAQNKRLIWRGEANRALSHDPVMNARHLRHAVDDMFKSFPPPSRG